MHSFSAAYAIAKAQSLPEALQLHTEFFQKLAAQTAEQTKEYFDLSTRATQHVFEQMQVAAAKTMKADRLSPKANIEASNRSSVAYEYLCLGVIIVFDRHHV